MVTNNPVKFYWNPLSGLGDEAGTSLFYLKIDNKGAITLQKKIIVKNQDFMYNKAWWQTILWNSLLSLQQFRRWSSDKLFLLENWP
jgi:hypothetical protein